MPSNDELINYVEDHRSGLPRASQADRPDYPGARISLAMLQTRCPFTSLVISESAKKSGVGAL